jgi:hypothetical protein
MKRCFLVCCLLGLGLVAVDYGWCYNATLILTLNSGRCSLKVEADDESRTLRLRVQPDGGVCPIEKESMLSALKAASSKTDEPKLEGTYSSLCIGRLVDYPWLSQCIAEAAYKDPAWNARKGRPVKLDINKYVSNLLFENDISAEIGRVLGGGCHVISVTVEKVLVGTFRDVPGYVGAIHPGKVPFDAQVWFRLE